MRLVYLHVYSPSPLTSSSSSLPSFPSPRSFAPPLSFPSQPLHGLPPPLSLSPSLPLSLQPQRERYEHTVILPAETLQKTLARDFAKYTQLHIMAVHLHSHNFSTALFLEHYRDGKMIGEYGRLDPFHGYGPDQSFQPTSVAQRNQPLLAGDSLQFHCVFNTMKAKETINYGVSHGDEMCGPVILFYPHDATAKMEMEYLSTPEGKPEENWEGHGSWDRRLGIDGADGADGADGVDGARVAEAEVAGMGAVGFPRGRRQSFAPQAPPQARGGGGKEEIAAAA